MIIIWGAFWGIVVGMLVANNSFLGGMFGGCLGFFVGLTLKASLQAQSKETIEQAKKALAQAWQIEDTKRQATPSPTVTKPAPTSQAQLTQGEEVTNAVPLHAAAQEVDPFPLNFESRPTASAPQAPLIDFELPKQTIAATPAVASIRAIEGNQAQAETTKVTSATATRDNTVTPTNQQAADVLKSASSSSQTTASHSQSSRPVTRTVAAKKSPQKPKEPGFDPFTAAKNWLFGGNTVVRIGIVIPFLGLLFLAKFAVDNAIIPVEVRMALVAIAGVALLVFGWRTRETKPSFGLSLQGAGVAVLYLTVFASFKLYQLFPAQMAFVIMALICAFSTVMALAQNARALAIIGFAGGFLVPVLISTGSGNHVALFSYYALLNLGVLAIAWFKTWRLLSLIAFFLTFGVAGLWAQRSYDEIHYATCQAFLVLGWAIYLAIALIYANRKVDVAQSKGPAFVDGTLFFGMALIGFGFQAGMVHTTQYGSAFSALAVGLVYIVVSIIQGAKVKQQLAEDDAAGVTSSSRLMAESALAIGIGFGTLAIPLAFGAQVTAAAWAVEGAAIVWVGRRQNRVLARAFGLLLQPLAMFVFVGSFTGINWRGETLPFGTFDRSVAAHAVHFFNPTFMGWLLLALGAVFISWILRVRGDDTDGQLTVSEKSLSGPFYFYGFLLWCAAMSWEMLRSYGVEPLIPNKLQSLSVMLMVAISITISFVLGRFNWSAPRLPIPLMLPMITFLAFASMAFRNVGLTGFGWIIWPIVLGLHYWLLYASDDTRHTVGSKWRAFVHTVSVWVIVMLLGGALVHAVTDANLWRTSWASVAIMIAAIAVLGVITTWVRGEKAQTRWPLQPYLTSYIFAAALPLVFFVSVGAFFLAVGSRGNADPLPYLPIINPTELTVLLAIAVVIRWVMTMRHLNLASEHGLGAKTVWVPFGMLAFVLINSIWLRISHHFFGVNWDFAAMFNSATVQAGYAILWSVMAMAAMIYGHRKAQRSPWVLGASLLGITVLKLIMVDMQNSGNWTRIIAFIGVGLLMLVVGYIAPLPPAAESEPSENDAVKKRSS